MRKIVIIAILALAIGMYGGSMLNESKTTSDISWGGLKEKASATIKNEMDDMTHQAGQHIMKNGQEMLGQAMSMEDMMHNMNKSIENKSGEEFDKEFLTQMIIHHEGAVEMAKQVLMKSKNPDLIKLANDIILAQTKEIKMMEEWKQKYK